ncbi:hypothetical protein C8R43DRAFT_1114590 [Mycena crocata]|nr:hypothetical protein C8R43DRAFT_1114590 [Mycena crocata]
MVPHLSYRATTTSNSAWVPIVGLDEKQLPKKKGVFLLFLLLALPPNSHPQRFGVPTWPGSLTILLALRRVGCVAVRRVGAATSSEDHDVGALSAFGGEAEAQAKTQWSGVGRSDIIDVGQLISTTTRWRCEPTSLPSLPPPPLTTFPPFQRSLHEGIVGGSTLVFYCLLVNYVVPNFNPYLTNTPPLLIYAIYAIYVFFGTKLEVLIRGGKSLAVEGRFEQQTSGSKVRKGP